jgi:hypothetical protein
MKGRLSSATTGNINWHHQLYLLVTLVTVNDICGVHMYMYGPEKISPGFFHLVISVFPAGSRLNTKPATREKPVLGGYILRIQYLLFAFLNPRCIISFKFYAKIIPSSDQQFEGLLSYPRGLKKHVVGSSPHSTVWNTLFALLLCAFWPHSGFCEVIHY